MLKDKWALVTGANRGIGKAIVETYAKNGARVIAAARKEDALGELKKQIKADSDCDIETVQIDVSDPDSVKVAFQQILKITKQLDIAVNNAGVLDNNLLPMIRVATMHEVYGVNAFGTVYVMQYASRMMMKHKSGSIINISSIVGVHGNAGQVAYAGSKAAVVGITLSAAKELAPLGIRVNAIAPGFIDTGMVRSLSEDKFKERMDSIKMGRIGKPQDIANCALFLASDLSEYVTGQVIGVDGGMLI